MANRLLMITMMSMSDKPYLFRDTYVIRSTRLRGWDYAGAGWYYVTICTKNRIPWFGEVHDKRMMLSNVGKIVNDEWNKTPIIRPYVTLDRYVIMPDHFHGIIVINEQSPIHVETPRRGVSTGRGVSTNHNKHHHPQWKSHSLGSIINHFKRACTVRIRENIGHDFAWQPRFYDHRIRNERETWRIRTYINNNPINWTCNDDA